MASRKLTLFTLLSLFSLFFYGSCKTTKTTSNQTKSQSEMKDSDSDNYRFKKNFSLSTNTRSLINEIEQELASKNIKISDYKPSKTLTEKYLIRKQGEDYIISGFIKVENEFNPNDLKNKGISFGNPSGALITVNVPIVLLEVFLSADHITYFEISERVTTK